VGENSNAQQVTARASMLATYRSQKWVVYSSTNAQVGGWVGENSNAQQVTARASMLAAYRSQKWVLLSGSVRCCEWKLSLTVMCGVFPWRQNTAGWCWGCGH